ncbi:hypothetical protein JCM10213_000394 [Rhodosporidiobolus nylandii]
MGSPPIPARSPPPAVASASSSSSTLPDQRPPAFRDRSPPRPHPGIQPARAPASVPFSPPKRRSGGVKGKERAFEGEEQDGEGDFPAEATVTWRHLLGHNNAGPHNPLRVVAVADIDAAYAAMEMARLGLPKDEPMAVQQWNGLIAVNYPARAFGITRHESPAEALKKCPHLRLVHVQTYKNGEAEPGYWEGAKPETHKVSLDMYRKESTNILAVFSEFCPVVEKASIDESYLDLTLPVRQALQSRYPALSSLPPGASLDDPLPPPSEFGIADADAKWDEVGNLIPVSGQKKEKLRRLLPDGSAAPPSSSPVKASTSASPPPEGADASPSPEREEPPLSWSDLCLALGAAIVRDIRTAVRERLGYTCSAGIAGNKMLAKLTSAWKKPDAQTILRHSCVPAFLRPMPFQKIKNLGGKLGTAVKEAYEAETVEDLLKFTLPELKAKLGEDSGMWLWEIVRGLDYTEVETKTQVKSMLSSKNFRPYISTYGEVYHWLQILATELHLRLSDARERSPGLWPKTITFTHRSPSFVIRSHQAPFPFTSTPSSQYILRAGDKLLRLAASFPVTGTVKDDTKIGPYSNIQLSFSGLERLEDGQRGIEGFFSAAAQKGRAPTGTGGTTSGKRAPSAAPGKEAKAAKKRKVAPSSSNASSAATLATDSEPLVLSSDSEPSSPSAAPESRSPSTAPSASKKAKRPRSLPTAVCARCSRILLIPDEAEEQLERDGWDEVKVKEALDRVEGEHRDWHVARDLLDSERKRDGWGLSTSSSGSSKTSSSSSATKQGGKKAKKKKGGIEAFFGKK